MKRPMLWVFGLLLSLFLTVRFFYGENMDANDYILDSFFEEKTACVAIGTLEHTETKPNSFYLYLDDVSVKLSRHSKTFQFSNLLIISKKQSVTSYHSGNKLKITGSITKFNTATNPGQFDEKTYYKEKNIYYKIQEINSSVVDTNRHFLKDTLFSFRNNLQAVYQTTLSKKDAGIVCAMLLGDKSLLDIDIKELYQLNGIGHILAISGVKTANLVSPIIAESGLKWAFVRVHIAKKYIQNLCFKGHNQITCPSRFRGG